jgi:hypothetical protein
MALAAAWAETRRYRAIALGSMVVIIVIAAIPASQRLALIAPLISVFIALASSGQAGRALRTLGVTVVVLAVASPFAVYLRDGRRDSQGQLLSAVDTAENYSVSQTSLLQSLQSIIDRADIVYVTTYMKDYIDNTEYVGWEYYYSVLVVPIPRFIYPAKPYVLSSNGEPDGEISVLAWRAMIGGTGSLSAFGGLTAYREGGWIGIILDGVAAGALFAFLARWLGEGSFVARIFYSSLFVIIAVQRVPPCFFEALSGFLGYAPLLLIIFVISRLLPLDRRSTAPRAASRPRSNRQLAERNAR